MAAPPHEPWPEAAAREATAALPPPRDDEPPSLRRDILDELTDHLACAFRRELLRTGGDPARAEANVRQRFGDPRWVARRLWFDAMKGRLMLQKVLIGTCAALVAACALFGLLLWRAVGDLRASNAALLRQSQEANAALLEQARQANAAALEQMRKLGPAAAPGDPEWNPVVIRLVAGAKGGPPAQGLTVRLDADAKDQLSPQETVGPTGVADFGLMRPGEYRLSIETPWGESLTRQLRIRPGRAVDLTVVCPAGPPETVPVEWNVRWPEAAAALESPGNLWCLAFVNGDLARKSAGDEWHTADLKLLAFRRDGRVIDLTATDPNRIPQELLRNPLVYRFAVQFLNLSGPPGPGRVWAEGSYQIREIGLARWNGEGSPWRLLADPSSHAAIEYVSHFSRTGLSDGNIGRVLQFRHDAPRWTAPRQGAARWTLDVPAGLVAWEEQLEERRRTRNSRQSIPLEPSEVLDLFHRAEPVAPVEAPRPARLTRPDENRWPPVPVSFVLRAGENGPPLEGVGVQLTRKDVPGDQRRFSLGDVKRTGPDGVADFGRRAQARYDVRLNLPWRESSSGELAVFSEIIRQPIVCPAAPPPTEPVRWSVTWPAAARRRNDLWLLLELSGEAGRWVGDRRWRSTDWRLVALQPDGRVLVWTRNSDRPLSYRSLDSLPDLLAELTPGHAPAGPADELLKGGKYAPLGVAIARWDGTGEASQLLRGLRDGRYASMPRGAFFHVFRELVPMKSDESLPGLTLQSAADAATTASFALPEPFVTAALRRWDTVPKAVRTPPATKPPAGD